MYNVPVSGSNAAPPHPAPPMIPGIWMVPWSDGGVNTGPVRYFCTSANASALICGVTSSTSSSVKPCFANGAGLVGNGCEGQARSPGTSEGATGRSSRGHTGSPVARSKVNTNPCFVTNATASMVRPPGRMVIRLGGAGRS